MDPRHDRAPADWCRAALVILAALVMFAVGACSGGTPETSPSGRAASARSTPAPDASLTPTPSSGASIAPPALRAELLAFIRNRRLWLVGADGSSRQRLKLEDVASFEWVDAGTIDAVTGADRSGHFLVDLAGRVERLPFGAGGAWSRDGMVYAVPVGQRVVVYGRDGAVIARLRVKRIPVKSDPPASTCDDPAFHPAHPAFLFGPPEFTPDGRSVVVAVQCSDLDVSTGEIDLGPQNRIARLYELSLDRKVIQPLPLTSNLRLAARPRFSPEGTRLAQLDEYHVGACFSPTWLTVADADGSHATRATIPLPSSAKKSDVGGGPFGGFHWSPDGDALVASFDVWSCQNPGGRPHPILSGLYVLHSDGSAKPTRLVNGETNSPVWSPSGGLVAFVVEALLGPQMGPPTIKVVDFRTRRLTDLGAGTHPAFQPQE